MIDYDWLDWGNCSDFIGGGRCPEFFRLCGLARLGKAWVVGLNNFRSFFSKNKKTLFNLKAALSGKSFYPRYKPSRSLFVVS